MGNRLTSEDEPQAESKSYADIFDEMFPHYLVMGMTPEQYWDGEVGLKRAYRKAFGFRIENEDKIRDRNNWMLGMYIREALASVPLLVNGFVPKGVQPKEYPDKPYLEKAEEQKKEEARIEEQERQTKLAMAMMQARFAQFNKRFEQQKAKEEASKTEE